MRPLPILLVAASACLLTACAGSTKFANPELSIRPVLEPAPAKLAAPCKDPLLLPTGRTLKQGEVESLWSTDRANLIDCRDRKAGEQGYYKARDTAIATRKD